MNRALRTGTIFIGVLLISFYGIALALGSYLRASVSERLHSQAILGGTTGKSFDNGIAGDSAKPLNGALALFGISKALDAYPDSFLRQRGPDVLISDTLTLYGYSVAGTVQTVGNRDWILLSSSYLIPSLNIDYVKRTFHHEFSSLLIAADPFPYLQWEQALPVDFSYPTSSQQSLEATTHYAPATELPRLVAAGFVSDYGMSSLENDINTYAEVLLNDSGSLLEMASNSSRVRQKAELIVQFYVGLNEQFADIFRANGLGQFLVSSGNPVGDGLRPGDSDTLEKK